MQLPCSLYTSALTLSSFFSINCKLYWARSLSTHWVTTDFCFLNFMVSAVMVTIWEHQRHQLLPVSHNLNYCQRCRGRWTTAPCTSLSSCSWQSFSFFRVLSITITARAWSFFLFSSSCCAFTAALRMFRSILSSSCSLSSFLMQYL